MYIAIDLKSFYASVECVERALDPLVTCLVVSDAGRTDKTICLAVSPGLKKYGIPGRPRLFEVVRKVRNINADRRYMAPGHRLSGKSFYTFELDADPSLELDYITAPPRMALYMKYSTDIYKIYLKYIAPEDIHVYSCDEVFMDVAPYLRTYGMTPHELAITMIQDVLSSTGITATAGIGTNMFLCKIAMDIVAKHMPADKDGVRIAELDEPSFREQLWGHTPLTDFWSIGVGTARRLASLGLFTMGDVAGYSEAGEDSLYKTFGIKAELLIDHAWGWEPCTIEAIKAYKPESNSISVGQVLQGPYTVDKARLIVREMADGLVLDLVKKGLATDQMVLTVGYDIENLAKPEIRARYTGPVTTDFYGREVPKQAHGSINLGGYTSSTRRIVAATLELYDRIMNPDLLVRRMYVVCNHVKDEKEAVAAAEAMPTQLDMFTDYTALAAQEEAQRAARERERKQQKVVLEIKEKWGKNAILRGMNFSEGATARERNEQVGGHKA